MTNTELSEFIDNEEGLYSWWRYSRKSKTAFIKMHRADIVSAIKTAMHRK